MWCAVFRWLSEIKPGDIAIVIATVMGPILAVRIQRALDLERETARARRGLFHALMRTRADPLSDAHVNALNAVPIEFFGVPTVTGTFNTLIEHTYTAPIDEAWVVRRNDLLFELLRTMAVSLNIPFSLDQLKREFYRPKWQNTVSDEQGAIRAQLARLLKGEIALPLEVTKMPSDPEFAAAFKEIILGQRALRMQIEPLASSTAQSAPQAGS